MSSIVPKEVKGKLQIMVPSTTMELKAWFEYGKKGPNLIEEFLNSSDDDFLDEDALTRITLPADAMLACTCDIIAVNILAPINAITLDPTTNPTLAPTRGPTQALTLDPTPAPTSDPTSALTSAPTTAPTTVPTAVHTSSAPTLALTAATTTAPTTAPTRATTSAPT